MNCVFTDLFPGQTARCCHMQGIHLIQHAVGRAVELGGQFVLLGWHPDISVYDLKFIGNIRPAAHWGMPSCSMSTDNTSMSDTLQHMVCCVDG